MTAVRYFHRLRNMKTIARLPLAQLTADETHVEAFKALAHLSRLQVFFLLVKAGREMSVGEIQEAVEDWQKMITRSDVPRARAART